MLWDLTKKYNEKLLVEVMEFLTSDHYIDYAHALAFMDQRVADIHEKTADDLIWFLEHPSLYTAGTSANETDLLSDHIPVFKTGRGGEYTYHGPGQRVAYAMIDLKKRQRIPDIKKYVWQLEEVIIRTLAEFDIKGERRCGRVGIWVDMKPFGGCDGQDSKIAAIGVRIRRWITLHGIAINLDPDLSMFNGIVPCGISEHGVTSIAALGKQITMRQLDKALKTHFEELFTETL